MTTISTTGLIARPAAPTAATGAGIMPDIVPAPEVDPPPDERW